MMKLTREEWIDAAMNPELDEDFSSEAEQEWDNRLDDLTPSTPATADQGTNKCESS